MIDTPSRTDLLETILDQARIRFHRVVAFFSATLLLVFSLALAGMMVEAVVALLSALGVAGYLFDLYRALGRAYDSVAAIYERAWY